MYKQLMKLIISRLPAGGLTMTFVIFIDSYPFFIDFWTLLLIELKDFVKFTLLRKLIIFTFTLAPSVRFSINRQKLTEQKFCTGVYFLRSFHAYGIFREQSKDNNKITKKTTAMFRSCHIKILWLHIKVHIYILRRPQKFDKNSQLIWLFS